MGKTTGTVKRSFYYYNLVPKKYDADGNLVDVINSETLFYEVFSEIKNTCDKIKTGEERSDKLVVKIENGDNIYIVVDKVEENEPIEFRLILCRTDALPYVENHGLLEFLTQYLPNDFALAEITHCVIFPKHNVMGAEFNFSGARATAIKSYLPRVCSRVEYLYCTPKLDGDVLRKLNRNEDLSLFRLAIKYDSNAMRELMDSKSIFQVSFGGVQEVDTFEIVLKRRKSKKNRGFESPIPYDQIEDFIKRNREDIKTFAMSQGSVQRDAVDLLHDKLVEQSSVAKTDNKTIDSESVYHIIKKFFDTSVRQIIK